MFDKHCLFLLSLTATHITLRWHPMKGSAFSRLLAASTQENVTGQIHIHMGPSDDQHFF